jgi:hypothetical protein
MEFQYAGSPKKQEAKTISSLGLNYWEAEGYILVGFLLRKGTVNVICYV